jgi:hypothetical protein
MSFPGDLPARDWTHLGIQVRPDGTVVLVLNRRSAFTFPTRIHVEPGRAWRILLAGRAVETELLVRHLIVWSGERYSGTGVDGHPGG